jgi:SNF2 family DNA or RNA helicase
MPFVIHGAWLRAEVAFPDGCFFLWAEDSTVQETLEAIEISSGIASEGRRPQEARPRTTKPLSHPAQVSAGQLRLHLVDLFPRLTAAQVKLISTTIWLPTTHGAPLSHGHLLHHQLIGGALTNGNQAPATAQAGVQLQAWQITGLAMTPFTALGALSHLDDQPTDQGDAQRLLTAMRWGNDLIFWSNAAKFTLQLLAGQHYLPTLRPHTANQLRAGWQPFLADPQIERQFERLTEAMPPVCRAYHSASLQEAPPPAELLNHCISALLDAAVRQWGAPQRRPALNTQGEQWLASLVTADPFLHLPPQIAFQLYQQWRGWSDQLYALHHAHVRVSFQLEAPVDTGPVTAEGPQSATWTLRYYLQARNNLDLRIAATEIWRSQQHHLQLGSRTVDQPQERLLAGLQVAARLSLPIQRSLRSPKPESAQLTTEESHQFLRETAPLLESSGFGVVLPDWWHTNQSVRLGLRLRLQGGETTDDLTTFAGTTNRERQGPGLIRYEWELMLGSRVLESREFERLAAIRSPLVKLNGQWVELDPQQVQTAQRFLTHQRPGGLISFLRALRIAQVHGSPAATGATVDSGRTTNREERPTGETNTAIGALASLLSDEVAALLPVVSVDVEGWLAQALARLNQQQHFMPLDEPADFIGELRPYQRRGIGWLAYLRSLGIGACLADDMGLGKTVQSIALLLHVRAQRKDHATALLICPTSVVANWRREVERFAPSLRVLVHHGGTRLMGDEFLQHTATYDLIITSYGTARRDVEFLTRLTWSDLILDEAQNIKNPTAKQTQAVLQLPAHNRIALTGTPVENRLSELWSIMEFLNPGYLEQYELFRRRYILPIERYNDEDQAGELRKVVQPFLLRRLKSDPAIIADLPEKNEMVVYCSLTQEQANLYEKVVSDTLTVLDQSEGIQRRGLVLGLLTKLKQICNHPAHYLKQEGPLTGRSSKLNRLTEMLEEVLAVGDSALVFTQFVEMGELLQRHIIETFKAETLFLHGRTPANQRERMVMAFQEAEVPTIFILSLRAGGAGINLTRANHVFHFDRWWNPAVESQATDRAFRIGQRRDVQVHKFVVAGTLEEHINQLLEDKKTLSEVVVGSGEQWLTELSTHQLRDLLLLRRDLAEDE